jgi:DNA-binding IclR family transcriptional regulator
MNVDASDLPRAVERNDASDDGSIVGRAFLILRAFRNEPVLGISAISRRTGIPRTTVHRLANQLYNEGALSRVGTKFRVGPTLFELGNLHFPERLRNTVQPLLDDLQRASGCDVSLVELVGNDVIFVATARGRRSNAKIGHLAQRVPAHSCAGGQVLLAQEGRRVTGSLASVTAQTITDTKLLHRRLSNVRVSGVAIEHGEGEDGRSSIAVTVVNRHGRVLAALMATAASNGLDIDAVSNTLQVFSRTFTAAGQRLVSSQPFTLARTTL